MHGENLSCFFHIVGNCYRGRQSLAHAYNIYAYNIYRYIADRKNNYYFEKKLKKVAKKFGRLKNMLYLCSRK